MTRVLRACGRRWADILLAAIITAAIFAGAAGLAGCHPGHGTNPPVTAVR